MNETKIPVWLGLEELVIIPRALIKDKDAETVRKTLGHASLEMTQKYVHSSSRDSQEAIDRVFNGKGK